jgi:hypothetical protein
MALMIVKTSPEMPSPVTSPPKSKRKSGNLSLLELLQDLQGIVSRAKHPVQLRRDDGVAWLHRCQEFFPFGPLIQRLRSTDPSLDEDTVESR